MKLSQRLFLLNFVAGMLVVATSANDTMVTLGAGGLVPLKSLEIVLESENLEISVHQIQVKYRFRNTSDHDVDGTVAFPLPPINGGTLENEPINLPTKNSINFVLFHVKVNGKPVSPEVEVRAFDKGKDISALLKLYGLPTSLMAARRKNTIGKLTEAQRADLLKDGIVGFTETAKPGSSKAEKDWWPWWDMRVQYFWTQRFPAGQTVEVEHSYAPVVGGSYIVASDNGESSVQPYCGDAETVKRIQEVKSHFPGKRDSDPVLLERRVQYILTTANNWRGPIGNFQLVVNTDGTDDIFAACMPGLERISSTRYEFQQANFRPDREINLLILQPNK